jgi:hypothetical protein
MAELIDHDKDMNEIREGDVVLVACTVEKLFPTGPHPNIQLRTLVPMHSHEPGTLLNLMGKQVSKADTRSASGRAEGFGLPLPEPEPGR